MEKPVTWPRLASAICACTISSAASAQQPTESSGVLEEVVVTAQRQEQNLQKTPIAVTSVTSDLFDKLGNGSVGNLAMVATSLQVAVGGPGQAIGIRGIITANTTDVGDPAVAFETDGLYHARAGTQGSTLFDVDRVEILRGPQGTLYGRNATTGVVNVISKRPNTQDFSADGYLEAGTYNAMNASAGVNVPLSDRIAVRAAAVSVNHNGYYRTGLGRSLDYGDQHENAARLTGLFNVTDDLTILLRGAYQGTSQHGNPTGVNIPLSADPRRFTAAAPGSANSTQYFGQAVIDWKLPWGTLTYEGGYHSSDATQRIASGGPVIVAGPLTSETQQHELRISNSVDKFKYVAGLFYFKEDQGWFIYVDPFARFLMPDEGQHSKAIFGQATYSFTDALRVTAGLRYTKDDKHRIGANYGFVNGQPVPTLVNFAFIDSSKLNYKFGVDYDLNPTSLLYASVATGYKQGGFFDGDQRTGDNTFKPENVLSFEIGSKNRFFDNRVQLNLAAFRYKYTDFQVSFQDTTLVTRTYNAQEARNTGLEVEIQAAASQHDRIGLSATYLRARYEQFDIPGGVDAFGRSSYSGNRLPFAPDLVVSAQYDHVWDLPNDRVINFGFVSRWQSDVDLEFHGFASTKQSSYSTTDVNLSWGEVTGRYSFTAFVRNLEDKIVLTTAALANNSTNANATATGQLAVPRTFGLRMNFKF